MHQALCRSSGTTIDILQGQRRAADRSANIGSRRLVLPQKDRDAREKLQALGYRLAYQNADYDVLLRSVPPAVAK